MNRRYFAATRGSSNRKSDIVLLDASITAAIAPADEPATRVILIRSSSSNFLSTSQTAIRTQILAPPPWNTTCTGTAVTVVLRFLYSLDTQPWGRAGCGEGVHSNGIRTASFAELRAFLWGC